MTTWREICRVCPGREDRKAALRLLVLRATSVTALAAHLGMDRANLRRLLRALDLPIPMHAWRGRAKP